MNSWKLLFWSSFIILKALSCDCFIKLFWNKTFRLKQINWIVIEILTYTNMVAEMLQKSKFLLCVLYLCYMKFHFDYIFHIYVICFIMYLLYIYMYIICFLILLYISFFISFDFEFVWKRFYFHYMSYVYYMFFNFVIYIYIFFFFILFDFEFVWKRFYFHYMCKNCYNVKFLL